LSKVTDAISVRVEAVPLRARQDAQEEVGFRTKPGALGPNGAEIALLIVIGHLVADGSARLEL
jgi:hypothetical protein